ncbi:MAG TPA: MOSC domain-containing protein [Chloroflexia bacterium]|nr:MOSC domain-containing protein [Chloroflexia bacterium]
MTDEVAAGRLAQISVSPGGVPKQPVSRAAIGPRGVEGDKQRDRRYHGGPRRAVCLYSMEHIAALQAEGHPIFPGAIGENLTVAGLDFRTLQVGDRLAVGDGVLLEITSYTVPCSNLEPFFADGKFIRVSQKVHPGWSRFYARVLQGGQLETGQPIRVLPRDPAPTSP